MKINVVEFCSFSNIYNDKLCEGLSLDCYFSSSYKIHKITISEERKLFNRDLDQNRYSTFSPFKKILYWINFAKYIQSKYAFNECQDVVNVQYVDFYMLVFYKYFKKNFKKVILTFWGSDLLRQNKVKLRMLYPLFILSDFITFETEDMKEKFIELFGVKFNSKFRLLRFGLSTLEAIDKCSADDISDFTKKYGINNKKRIVSIGYNRSKQQQHISVIDSMINMVDYSSILFILPWNYGEVDAEYKNTIESKLYGKYDYLFIEDRLSDREIAVLRIITDIMIQVQTTDSLSASMLETLYAGNQVITGKWLPYTGIQKMGLKMTVVDSVSQCGSAMQENLKNPLSSEEICYNKQCVYRLSSWSENIREWVELYKKQR